MRLPMATIRELLSYHYDRRERLYRFLEQLTPDELARDLKVGWRSIRGILLHALEAEAFWVQYAIMKGERPDWDFRAFPDIPAIRRQAGDGPAGERPALARKSAKSQKWQPKQAELLLQYSVSGRFPDGRSSPCSLPERPALTMPGILWLPASW